VESLDADGCGSFIDLMTCAAFYYDEAAEFCNQFSALIGLDKGEPLSRDEQRIADRKAGSAQSKLLPSWWSRV
jgi:hypothetical protein